MKQFYNTRQLIIYIVAEHLYNEAYKKKRIYSYSMTCK